MNELTEWIAYSDIEPWGFGLVDMHHAELTAAVLNSAERLRATTVACHGQDAEAQYTSPSDLSFWSRAQTPPEPPPDIKASIAKIAEINAMLGGIDQRGKK